MLSGALLRWMLQAWAVASNLTFSISKINSMLTQALQAALQRHSPHLCMSWKLHAWELAPAPKFVIHITQQDHASIGSGKGLHPQGRHPESVLHSSAVLAVSQADGIGLSALSHLQALHFPGQRPSSPCISHTYLDHASLRSIFRLSGMISMLMLSLT